LGFSNGRCSCQVRYTICIGDSDRMTDNNKSNNEKIKEESKYDQEQLNKLEASVDNARREWKGDRNVVGIGFGSKHREGKVTDELSITFHVRRKLAPESAIRAIGSKPIPSNFEGFLTDVKVFNVVKSSATGDRDEKRYDPLIGGVMTSNAENNILWFNGAGTLGTLCFRGDSLMALSNWHVWADGGERGDDIIQPGHPRGREHLEGLGKVIFCGPLLASLFEWHAPSPLTWALYGGAAAAAIAAAASDEIDPIRRGQKETSVQPGERTIREQLNMEIKYVEQPIPGTSYKVEAEWMYKRNTDRRVRDHSVQETRTNPHVLAFKQLWSDKTEYEPGSRVNLSARIGSSHSRSCDSYYAVAHFIQDRDPSRLISTVLSPAICYIVPDDKGDTKNCVDFSQEKLAGNLGAVIQRGRIRFIIPSTEQENKLVDLNSDENRELLLLDQLIISVPPCKRIEATIVSAGPKLKMNAYHAGKLVGETKSNQTGDVTLSIEADVIDSVILISDPE
jgi:hypothetical protein